jgi:beta-phosphoglucomutase family hydrolase
MSPIDFSQYDAFIFDMDGTLVDSMPAHLEAWRIALENQQAPVHIEFVGDRGGMPTAKIAKAYNQAFGLTLDEEKIVIDKRAAFDDLWHHIERIEATVTLLIEFQNQKKMALGTGADRVNMERIIKSVALEPYLQFMVCADDVNGHKPEPDTFLAAAQALGVAPERCLVFEDTPFGLQAAHNGHMDCVIIKGGRLDAFQPAP